MKTEGSGLIIEKVGDFKKLKINELGFGFESIFNSSFPFYC